jgi:UDPglucose--hexose-1-phosphate uridylyltransferase
MDCTSDTVFEMRTDPTTGRRVLIAEARAARPSDFADDTAIGQHSLEKCPFCRGHEWHTPHELAVVNDSQGEWQIRVVPNKYPAVAPAPSGGRKSPAVDALQVAGDLRPPLAPDGVHEVIIESPRHIQDWSELATDEIAKLLQVFRERIAHAYTNHGMRSALLFKNVGQGAGASLEHIHSQLIALPFVPEVLETELAVAAEFQSHSGECLMCRLLANERSEGSRFVIENDHFAAFCAYAGRQPYETWIVPKVHASDFLEISAQKSLALAEILGELVRRLRTLLAPLAYNLVLHTAPVGDERQAAFHWHWELIPRSTSLAGFEWGTGMHINSVSPERAAIRLRASKSGEKVPIQ